MTITGPDTEKYDRFEKFELYCDIPSLQEYILISSKHIMMEQFSRSSAGKWLMTPYKSLEESLYIESIGEGIPLSEVYSRVTFIQP